MTTSCLNSGGYFYGIATSFPRDPVPRKRCEPNLRQTRCVVARRTHDSNNPKDVRYKPDRRALRSRVGERDGSFPQHHTVSVSEDASSVPVKDEPPWWTSEWRALADDARDSHVDRAPTMAAVTPEALDALRTSDAILSVWPRLTGEQRDVVRRRVKSEGVLVSGELFACLATAMPEEAWEPSNIYISNLFGPSWT